MSQDDYRAFLAKNLDQTPPIRILDRIAPESAAVPSGRELALHAEIMKECRRRGWSYVYHDPTRKTGATLGTPDFIIYASGGHVLNVECKTATGKLSKDQKNFKDAIQAQGHAYYEVRSVDYFRVIADNIKNLVNNFHGKAQA